jgi:hypothetical protein
MGSFIGVGTRRVIQKLYHVVRWLQSKAGMKNHILVTQIVLILGIVGASAGCSTFQSHKNSEDIAASGPTILNAKADPSTVQLNPNLQPKENALLFADVKDFDSRIQNVHVRFIHVPIDLPMKQVAGTTWEAELTPGQLKELAVSGQTIRYEANVIAMNEKGQTAVSSAPISLSIQAPAPDQLGGISGMDSNSNNNNNENNNGSSFDNSQRRSSHNQSQNNNQYKATERSDQSDQSNQSN